MYPSLYKVHLPVFEGPLDLLLHLIKKEDLAVSDIPIALVLDQYMHYLEVMQELNIDLAGEFILMAAELSWIKSKMLLPVEEEEEEEEDPRANLAKRLLEYQRYKEAAGQIGRFPLLDRDVFAHPPVEKELAPKLAPIQGDPFKLLLAFSEVLKRLKPEKVHEVIAEHLSVSERIYELIELTRQERRLSFQSLFQGCATKGRAIVTFLALLEMVRLKMVSVVFNEAGACEIEQLDQSPSLGIPQMASEFDREQDPAARQEIPTPV